MDFDDLSCHFKWKPEEGDLDNDENFEAIIEHTKNKINNEYDIDLLAKPLIAYLFCKADNKNLLSALEWINDYLANLKNKQQEKTLVGYETVGLSNKIFILKEMGQTDEALKILRVIKKLDELSDEQQAVIQGLHAYALSLFGRNNYQRGLNMYKEARKLDKNNYMWCFGVGYLAGRIRRQEEGAQSLPTEMEEQSYRHACELSHWEKPVPIVFLADTLIRGKSSNVCDKNDKLLAEAKKFYQMAYDLHSHSAVSFKKLGKAFSQLDEEDLAEECFTKAVKLDPHSSQAFHYMAQFYEFRSREKSSNLDKEYLDLAETNYRKAVTAGRRRNFYAECDLARARKKRDVKYDLIKHYEDMKPYYEDDPKCLEQIDSKIKDIKDYHYKKYDKKTPPKTHVSVEGCG